MKQINADFTPVQNKLLPAFILSKHNIYLEQFA